jgi:hypothetical protein
MCYALINCFAANFDLIISHNKINHIKVYYYENKENRS